LFVRSSVVHNGVAVHVFQTNPDPSLFSACAQREKQIGSVAAVGDDFQSPRRTPPRVAVRPERLFLCLRVLFVMVTQLKAAAQRAPRSRHRGKQRGPLESLKQPDGTYAKSAMQRKLYASRRQFKVAQQTIDRQAVLLAQSQARAEELVEQEKTRKRSHTEQGAKFSAKNLVLTQVGRWIGVR
jgi:hypothetical protein